MTDNIMSKNCYLYVLDTLSDWEIGYITAELNSGRYLSKDIDVKFTIIGNSRDPITTMGGFTITPEKSQNDITFQEGDLLILPGANTWMEASNEAIINRVSELLNSKVIIAAICGATIALAQKGLLNKRKHTSNDKDYLKMICPEYSGEKDYISIPVVVDENLITATGIAPLEFSYEILKKLDIMKNATIEAWYNLYNTKESKYFYDLMESLK